MAEVVEKKSLCVFQKSSEVVLKKLTWVFQKSFDVVLKKLLVVCQTFALVVENDWAR